MDKNKTLIKYLVNYLDYLEIERGLSPKTQENYARFLNKFFEWLKDTNNIKIKPKNVTADLIWKYRVFLSRHIDYKTKKTLKKSTQNYYLIALRSMLDFFVEKKISSLSPTSVKLAKDKSDKEIKFLKLEQVEKLLLAPNTKTLIGLRDRTILETLFSTGLRVAELVSLNKEQMRISKTATDLEIAVTGKGEKVRSIYFSNRSLGWLKMYLKTRTDTDTSLFVNYKRAKADNIISRRLTTRSIENIVKKYVKLSGLPLNVTPHTLRHSFATDLLGNGVDLRLVQEFLGHQNIATTQIYTHVTNKQLKDLHKKVHSGNKMKN